MQVILKENIENLGSMGSVIEVKPGYARNYLIPQGLAIEASKRRIKQLDHSKRLIEAKRKKELKDAESVAEKIGEMSVTIPVQVGIEDKLYGTVTNIDIAEALAAQGVEIDRKKISIDEPIKALGVYHATVKIAPEVNASLKIWVVKQQ